MEQKHDDMNWDRPPSLFIHFLHPDLLRLSVDMSGILPPFLASVRRRKGMSQTRFGTVLPPSLHLRRKNRMEPVNVAPADDAPSSSSTPRPLPSFPSSSSSMRACISDLAEGRGTVGDSPSFS